MKRILLLLIIVVMTAACSIPSLDEVLSDTRTNYKKSQSLPPLDVPPDLSASEAKGTMGIPGETTTASLKAYQNRNNPQYQTASNTPQNTSNTATTTSTSPTASTSASTSTAPAAVSVPLPNLDADGGVFITVPGGKAEIWNKLRNFFTGKGYQLALDDIDLGYMETAWSEPAAENGHTYRHKFKVFTETEKDPGVTGLYIDNEQQEQVSGAGGTTWQDVNKNADAERLMAGAMMVYLNGAQAQVAQQPAPAAMGGSTTPSTGEPAAATVVPATTHTASALPARAEIRNLGDNKILLAVPEEYTLAWRRVGEALQRAGLVINGSDQGKGVYHITYQGAKPEKSGWLSKLKKLKFWGKHENEGAGTYQVALTGVGEKTEIVVLTEDGGWASDETSNRILSMIQTQYNKL